MKMELKDIQKLVLGWSGFALTGTNKQELKDNLERIKYQLEFEISDTASRYDRMIDSLDLEEGC